MRVAIVFGGAGQDGRILSRQLHDRGMAVLSLDREAALWWAEQTPSPTGSAAVDVTDAHALRQLISDLRPEAVFYLAAHHHSSDEDPGEEGELWRASLRVHVEGAIKVLDAIRLASPHSRFFYAGSSHMFGEPEASPQSESTPWRPLSPYAITKTAGAEATGYFRRHHGLHASVGVLFNHESPLRPMRFLSRRIAQAARASRHDDRVALEIADLSSRVDWGWAADYTAAMQKIVEHEAPGDWVIATGETHSVEEMCRSAFAAVGREYHRHVRQTGAALKRPARALVGDSSRLRAATGWSPTMNFDAMVRALVEGVADDP